MSKIGQTQGIESTRSKKDVDKGFSSRVEIRWICSWEHIVTALRKWARVLRQQEFKH
jgi:hypothetical protein